MKRDFAAALVAALAALTVLSGCGRQVQEAAQAAADEEQATPVLVTTAVRGSIEDVLELTGTAQAADEVDVVPEVAGKVTAVYADVGDYVSRGRTLVRLDTELASAQQGQAAAGVAAAQARLAQAEEATGLTDQQTAVAVRQAEVGLRAAREQLNKARTAAKLRESTVESSIQQARNGVKSAEAGLRDVRAGARDQQLRQAQEQVTQAQSSLTLAKQTYERYNRLHDKGVIATQQLDQARTQYEVAQAQYEQAVEAQSLVQEGARTEQVRLAELGVEQAKEGLRLAEAARDQVEMARRDVASAEQGVRLAEEQLNAARANRQQVALRERDAQAAAAGVGQAASAMELTSVQISKHSVIAPISGLIAMRMVDPGEGASPGIPVMRIVDLDPIRVEAVVSELDRVEKGQRGMVSVDGLSGEEFVGTVRDIAPQASMDSRNYVARIHVDNPSGKIKPGMFARVQMVLESRADTVLVTRDTIVERGEGRLVYVVTDGAVEIREVQVGAVSGRLMEVLDGVEEGARLVVTGQTALAGGQRVTAQDRAAPSQQKSHTPAYSTETGAPQEGLTAHVVDQTRDLATRYYSHAHRYPVGPGAGWTEPDAVGVVPGHRRPGGHGGCRLPRRRSRGDRAAHPQAARGPVRHDRERGHRVRHRPAERRNAGDVLRLRHRCGRCRGRCAGCC